MNHLWTAQVRSSNLVAAQIILKHHLRYWKHKRQAPTRQSCLHLDKEATSFQFSLHLPLVLCHDIQIDIKYLGSTEMPRKAITCKYHQASLRTEQWCGAKSAVLGCAVTQNEWEHYYTAVCKLMWVLDVQVAFLLLTTKLSHGTSIDILP